MNCILDVHSTSCTEWKSHPLSRANDNDIQVAQTFEEEAELGQIENERQEIVPKESDYVAAVYEKQWYIGRVIEIDEEDALINFMCNAGKYADAFKWPTREDEIWVKRTNILTILDEPKPHGKTKRIFKIPNEELKRVEEEFTSMRDKL